MISTETREDGWRIVVLGAAGFLLIFVMTDWRLPARIESDLSEHAGEVLSEAGFDALELSVDGLDVVLEGSVATIDDRRRAAQLVSGVYGVRIVDNRLQTGATGGDPPVEPSTQQ